MHSNIHSGFNEHYTTRKGLNNPAKNISRDFAWTLEDAPFITP